MSSLDCRKSKDDSWPLIYDLRLTSQFTRHLTSLSIAYVVAPYLPRTAVYDEAANSYPIFGYEPFPLHWCKDGTARWRLETMSRRRRKDNDINRKLQEREAREIVRRTIRKLNIVTRKEVLRDMGRRCEVELDLTPQAEICRGNSLERLLGLILRPAARSLIGQENQDDMNQQTEEWLGRNRNSRTRTSGHLARWAGRISATTVGGFAGGGVPRPERSDPLAAGIVGKPIRISVPAGLSKAAEAQVKEHQEWQQAISEARSDQLEADMQARQEDEEQQTMPHAERKRRDPTPIVRYRTVNKGRSSRFRTQTAAKSKLQSYRRIHGRRSLLPPPSHSREVTSANMDLIWSTASSVVANTSSEADSDSDSESEAATDYEEQHKKDEKAPLSKEDETQDHSQQMPDTPHLNIGTLDDEPPFLGSTTQFRPPWAFPQSDDEASSISLDPDPWPEPDHRYTHLGPGRGKATRHLEAVSKMGFAGGGLRRPRASDVLPPLGGAGGGTVGRVKEVPEGLKRAAEEVGRRVKEDEGKGAGNDVEETKPVVSGWSSGKKSDPESVEEEDGWGSFRKKSTSSKAVVQETSSEDGRGGAWGTTTKKCSKVEKLDVEVMKPVVSGWDSAWGAKKSDPEPVVENDAWGSFKKKAKLSKAPVGTTSKENGWPVRVSHKRNSGRAARWERRLSVTTVGGFAGGGVPRPARDVVPDIDDDEWLASKGKAKVPEGLRRAAERAYGKAPVPGKWKDAEKVAWPEKRVADKRKEEWDYKWPNGEEEYCVEMEGREFEVIEPVVVEESAEDMRKRLRVEVYSKTGRQTRRTGGYEVLLSAALIVLAILYACELRGKHTT